MHCDNLFYICLFQPIAQGNKKKEFKANEIAVITQGPICLYFSNLYPCMRLRSKRMHI